MRNRRWYRYIFFVLLFVIATPAIESCGSLHSFWGVENDYYSGDGYEYGRPRPPKHKKYKKHKKHKKHKHHHDWDDD